MKFSSGVDGLSKENSFLRTLAKVLLAVIVILLGMVVVLFDKDPVVIERSSRGLEIVKVLPFSQDPSDLNQAIRLMMKGRFDSEALSPELFLNPKELILRDTEQRDLKSRNMTQTVIVRAIKITKDEALVDIDRVISVGELRSALKAKIKIAFEQTHPNELNPYGLLLSLAEPQQKQTEDK